jgi:hypothetical protein
MGNNISINYKKKTSLSDFLVIIFLQGSAQMGNRNIVFAELSNKGAFYSLNYEHIFHCEQNRSWSYRVGGFIGNDGVAIPLGLNLFTGQYNDHAEFSLLVTPYVDYFHSILNKTDTSDKYLYLSPTAGYRYQKPGGKFYFKASAGPSLFMDPPSVHFWHIRFKLYATAFIGCGFCF